MKRKIVLPLIYIISAVIAARADSPKTPDLQFEFTADAVRIHGAKPGVFISLMAVGYKPQPYRDLIFRISARVRDDDGDGIAEYKVDGGVPKNVVWVAVDEEDGRYAAAHWRYALRSMKVKPDHLRRDAQGGVAAFSYPTDEGAALLVRPGKGAWEGIGAQGNAADGHAGSMVVHFARMKARDGSALPGPDHLLPNDVLVVISVSTLETYLVRWTGQ